MTKQLKPYHESVVDAINRADVFDLETLARLIMETAIPKDHDEIATAWTQQCKEVGSSIDFGVPDSVMDQKKAAENKEKVA